MNDKKLVLTGVFWRGAQLIINQSFSFIIKLILAKLLFPEQFGLVGMATVFTGFIQVLNDLGIGAMLVQRKDEELREAHFHTAFWTGIVWSILLYIIISFLLGPLASKFYNQPILQDLIPVLSLGILCSPINLVHVAQLTRNMNFKRIAFINNFSSIISGSIALGLAFFGAGVWSLVFNSVASFVITMPLYFIATGWKPKFVWEKWAFKDVFGFGIYTTGTKVITYIINNFDYFLIGKLLSAQALGAYTFAFVLTDTFRNKLMSVINSVMYPMYGKRQSDNDIIKKYYLKVVKYNSIIVYPIMVLMIVLGKPFMLTFFGDKWIDAVIPLKILSVAVMVHMMVNSNAALIRGIGRPDLEFKLQMIKASVFVPTLAIGIYLYGIIGASIAVLVNKFIAVLIAQYTFNKLLKIRVSTLEFLSEIKTPWIASIVTFILSYFFYNSINVHFVIVGIFIIGVYFLLVYYMMGKEIITQIKQFKTKEVFK